MDIMVAAEDVWEKVNKAIGVGEGRVNHRAVEESEMTTDSEYDWEN